MTDIIGEMTPPIFLDPVINNCHLRYAALAKFSMYNFIYSIPFRGTDHQCLLCYLSLHGSGQVKVRNQFWHISVLAIFSDPKGYNSYYFSPLFFLLAFLQFKFYTFQYKEIDQKQKLNH
jgi:hypothetical protein